ncbi:polysaccharide lyase family 8 super-sandwich domain-containing protein, partial [Brachybacterium tyrofermentans]
MPDTFGARLAVPRRAVLTGSGVAVGLGLYLLGTGPGLTPLPDQPAALRERWIEAITARARIDRSSARIVSHLDALDEAVRSSLDSADKADGNTEIFSRYPIDGEDSSAVSGSATWLARMAQAWITPGSDFSQDHGVRSVIVSGVQRLLENAYHEGADAYGNWWTWEIGAPRPLADLMCIMRDELPEQVLRDAAAAIRYFIPDPAYSELQNYPSTASNRVNTVRAALVAAIAEDDSARIDECVDALPGAWKIVDEKDGFYADGGFIQHLDVAYTGNYGADLIRTVAPMLTLLEGTEHDVDGREDLWDLIDSAFLPVMVDGHVLDSVRGRAVARIGTNGSAVGRDLVGAIAEIARTAPRARREGWLDLIGWWASRNTTVDLLGGADLPGAVALLPVAQREATSVKSPVSTYFASMDRLIHRTESWTMAVSMCSNRIAAFEGTEAENSRGVLTGNAMRYLFIDDDPAPFDDYFWATLDYSRPPGTTNHRISFSPISTQSSSRNRPENEWTGGLLYRGRSLVAMHQVGLDGEAPACRRFTVATSTAVLELVSDIRSDYDAFTTVENRMLPHGATAGLTVNGSEVEEPTTVSEAHWAHLEGVGGYVFPQVVKLDAGITKRVGSTSTVQQQVDEIPASSRVARKWAALDLRHEGGSNSASWVLLPHAEASDTRAASEALESGEHAMAL